MEQPGLEQVLVRDAGATGQGLLLSYGTKVEFILASHITKLIFSARCSAKSLEPRIIPAQEQVQSMSLLKERLNGGSSPKASSLTKEGN